MYCGVCSIMYVFQFIQVCMLTHVAYTYVHFKSRKPGKSKESPEEDKRIENLYAGWFIPFYNLQDYTPCKFQYAKSY